MQYHSWECYQRQSTRTRSWNQPPPDGISWHCAPRLWVEFPTSRIPTISSLSFSISIRNPTEWKCQWYGVKHCYVRYGGCFNGCNLYNPRLQRHRPPAADWQCTKSRSLEFRLDYHGTCSWNSRCFFRPNRILGE